MNPSAFVVRSYPLFRSRERFTLLGLLLVSAFGATPAVSADVASWEHSSFEDFREGTFSNSGQNLYVSRDGDIQTIRRFDLNQDGFIDLAFNSTHDWFHEIPASLATFGPDGTLMQTEIAVQGSKHAVARDLDRDGYTDLVFHPAKSNMRHPRNFLTIAWGSSNGWPKKHISRFLPLHGSTTLAVADIDRDGWPDIFTLNGNSWQAGQPSGRILRIYWGAAEGYRGSEFLDLGVGAAVDMLPGDFDGNGYEDLAVVEIDGAVKMFWNTPGARQGKAVDADEFASSGEGVGVSSLAVLGATNEGGDRLVVGTDSADLYLHSFSGRESASVQRVSAFNANQISVGDLDRDGHADLILAALELARASGGEAMGAARDAVSSVQVLWGSDAGFDKAQREVLPDRIVSMFRGARYSKSRTLGHLT